MNVAVDDDDERDILIDADPATSDLDAGPPQDVLEAALAHKAPNAVEGVYARIDHFERRRALMDAWAAYLAAQKVWSPPAEQLAEDPQLAIDGGPVTVAISGRDASAATVDVDDSAAGAKGAVTFTTSTWNHDADGDRFGAGRRRHGRDGHADARSERRGLRSGAERNASGLRQPVPYGSAISSSFSYMGTNIFLDSPPFGPQISCPSTPIRSDSSSSGRGPLALIPSNP